MLQITPQHVPHFSTLDHRVQMEQHVNPSPSVQLPRRLTRPVYMEVDTNAIAAVNPELSGVPIEYVEKYLASLSPQYVDFTLSLRLQDLTTVTCLGCWLP